MREIHIFLDTMIFLHYKSIEDIDFSSLLGAEKIKILIPRITIRELDKAKNVHHQRRIRERAKKVLNKIEEWMLSAEPIRSGITVLYYETVPSILFEKYGLNPDWSDDYLLATLMQYKHDNPKVEIYLISQDSGPRLTAQHLGISAFELPEEFKIPILADPIELENIELRKTVAKLQSALPHLIVCFAGSDPPESHAKFLLPEPLKQADDEIETKLKEIKDKYPKRYPRVKEASDPSRNIAVTLSAIQSYAITTSPEEYERYNSDVDEYLTLYEQYMKDSWKIKEVGSRTIKFQPEVRNIGTAPADDVDFCFYFPDGFTLEIDEDFPPIPKKPVPPVEPRSQGQIIAESIDRFRHFPNMALPRPYLPQIHQPSTFNLKRTKSYELTDHTQRIKHGDGFLFPELYLTFDSFEKAHSFSCDYIIRPANLPEPLQGMLHFVIRKGADVNE